MSFIYGFHAIECLLSKRPEGVEQFFVHERRQDQRLQQLLALANQHGIESVPRPLAWFDEQFSGQNHQGVALACQPPQCLSEDYLFHLLDVQEKPPFLLMLDGVQDPHNLGACLRSALAAGVDAVIIPKDRAVGLTPTVVHVSCGAALILPVISVTNLVRTMSSLKERGVWSYGAAEQGSSSLYQQDLKGPLLWVLGAEGKGLRRLTRETCDVLCQIPTDGHLSSLNVSVAVGVCLFESLRQRLPAG